jgi:signal transduction histidine kinase/streptogramin lyase
VCYCQRNLKFEHFTTANGLSENFVYAVFQDSKGFLWIGTHEGLNRYDGYGFKKFRHDPADSNSLPDNTINDICEDGDGNLWLATNTGLCRFDPLQNSFKVIASHNIYAITNQVLSVGKDKIISYSVGIILTDIRSNEQVVVSCNDSSSEKFNNISYPLSKLSKDRDGNIYVGKNLNGTIIIWKLDTAAQSFVYFTSFAIDKKLSGRSLKSFFITDNGECWIHFDYDHEVLKVDLKTKMAELIFLCETNTILYDFFEDDEKNVWMSTDVGLFMHESATGKLTILRHKNDNGSLTSNLVRAIYGDKTGVLWIGTANGLNKLNPVQIKFRHITADDNDSIALKSNFVLGVYPEKTNEVRIHYFETDNSFSRWDLTNNAVSHCLWSKLRFEDWIKEIVVINHEKLTDSIFNNIVLSFQKLHITRNSGDIRLFIDSNKNTWLIRYVALFELYDMHKDYYSGFIITDAQLHGNEIWFGTVGDGLLCFDIPTRTLAKYKASQGVTNAINSNDITGFVFETNGNMWVSTMGGGLNYFDRSKKTFTHYTEADGLCNNSIYCLVKDNNNRLWLGTSKGLSCFDISTKKFRNYFRSDGLINDEFNRYSACKLANGTILMGGMNGIDYFNPNDFMNQKNKPLVQITDFKVYNESIIPGPKLTLAHNHNYITIEFAAMDFADPSNNKFQCMLYGVDKDWVKLEHRNFINYSLLPPGHYHFEVKAANSDGIWSTTPASVDFIILPPWYGTWWFISALVFIFIAVAYFIIRLYVKRKLEKQKAEFEKQKAIESERVRISTELHDDLGGGLSTIRLLSEMMQAGTSNGDGQKQLSKISEFSKELVQKMNEIVWTLNVSNDNLQSLIIYIRQYAIKFLDNVDISCHINVPENIPDVHISGTNRRNIFLIVKEALHNIVKHAEASSVEMKIFFDDALHISIYDNGKGIPQDIQPGGNGMRNMYTRAKALHGSMHVENRSGTTIHFSSLLQNLSRETVS